MKNIYIAFFVSCFTLGLTAQSERSLRQNEWLISVGLNAVNSLGTKSPFKDPGDWAYRFPLSASIEGKWFDLFSIEVAASLNGIAANQRLDGSGPPEEDLTYFAVDTNLKYYFGEFIFPRTEWIDFYVASGLGLFFLDDTNITINAGAGVQFWLDRGQAFGIKLQGMGKFAFDHSDRGQVYPNNHFQYHAMFVFRLD